MKLFDAVPTLLIGANRLSISTRNHIGIILAMSVTGIWGGEGMKSFDVVSTLLLGANRLSISARNHIGIILAMSVTGSWGREP
ncbi:hypothetical protein HLBENOHH_03651 [Aeromonas dhakensis]|uniref:hypothetical protein n=1 Tax=Aeromonas dhakensis TaxID=196024 RepID=UPI00366E25A6